MQRHAFEVQLAATEEYEPAEVAVDLGAITAPSLVVSGALVLPCGAVSVSALRGVGNSGCDRLADDVQLGVHVL